MNTKLESISGNVYCAYCGNILKDRNSQVYPEPQLICTCEKAKEEMELYDKLRDLYNLPLADNLIELKVKIYRNKLKGIEEPTVNYGIIGSFNGQATPVQNSIYIPQIFGSMGFLFFI